MPAVTWVWPWNVGQDLPYIANAFQLVISLSLSNLTLVSDTLFGKFYFALKFSSVQFNGSVVSDSLRPHESQYTRPPCTSPSPGVHSGSRPSSPWCHPVISSSVDPFSSCPQFLPASESSPMSQLFAWGGQKYWSFSFSIIPSKEHPGLISFRMDWLLSES